MAPEGWIKFTDLDWMKWRVKRYEGIVQLSRAPTKAGLTIYTRESSVLISDNMSEKYTERADGKVSVQLRWKPLPSAMRHCMKPALGFALLTWLCAYVCVVVVLFPDFALIRNPPWLSDWHRSVAGGLLISIGCSIDSNFSQWKAVCSWPNAGLAHTALLKHGGRSFHRDETFCFCSVWKHFHY